MIGIVRGVRQRLARLKPVRVPEAPARAFRDLWPGDPARGARLLRGEFETLGTARPLREYIETLRDAIDPALPLGLGNIPYGPQQVMFLQADITQLAADTGFAPRTAFADGIRATIAWAKTQKQTN